MRTLIISSGSIEDYEAGKVIAAASQFIICADGGARHAYEMGIMPDIIIGDMDSAAGESIGYYKDKGVGTIEYDSDKDKTDTQICVEYAMAFSDEIILLGATGSRIDHMLANLSLLKLGLDRKIRMCILDSHNEIYLTDSSISISGGQGEFFSLIPMSEQVSGICTKGAHYELTDAVMEIGMPYGVSNYFEAGQVEIRVGKGKLLVIKSRD